MVNSNLQQKLLAIQAQLKAPKDHDNAYGGFKYRSLENIIEALKPLLKQEGVVLLISDEIVQVGDRYYVKATATVKNGDELLTVTAFARETLERKKMDDAQITGAASSYARKYALNGLFLIDDTKDPDSYSHASEPKRMRVDNVKAEANAYIENMHLSSSLDELRQTFLNACEFAKNNKRIDLIELFTKTKDKRKIILEKI